MAAVTESMWDDECFETNFDKCKAIFDRTYDAKGTSEEVYNRAVEYADANFEANGSAADAEAAAIAHMDALMQWSRLDEPSSDLK